MTRALYIGGASPEHAMRLRDEFAEVTVIATQDERREFWSLPPPAGVRVMVADPLAIDVAVQPQFKGTFDAVYLDRDTPSLREQAKLFLKPTGSLGIRSC